MYNGFRGHEQSGNKVLGDTDHQSLPPEEKIAVEVDDKHCTLDSQAQPGRMRGKSG